MSDPTVSLADLLLSLVPEDGTSIGNTSLRRLLSEAAGGEISQEEYFRIRDPLITSGRLMTGSGRGGSVRRAGGSGAPRPVATQPAEAFSLTVPEPAPAPEKKAPEKKVSAKPPSSKGGAKQESGDPQIVSYRHDQRRKNNPEVGMVSPDTDPDQPKTRWAYDPHIDPALEFDVGRGEIEILIDEALASGDPEQMRQALEELKRRSAPYLNWAGKAERTSFDIDTVSLHVHERIDPMSVLSSVRAALAEKKKEGAKPRSGFQLGLFNAPFETLPLRDAIDFYKHDRGWANRLIAGDSLLVMNSLIQKEGMAGQVQMIYIDPPYGIKYGSNFQPFVNKREVKDGKDEDLTQEPEMIKAFRDTWELGIHSYLTYLRDRLLLARELLSESGSVFVQISDENVHHVREMMDEIFGPGGFVSLIPFVKTSGLGSTGLATVCDYLLWYCMDKGKLKYHQLYFDRGVGDEGAEQYSLVETWTGTRRRITSEERENPSLVPVSSRILRMDNITSGAFRENTTINYEYCGRNFHPGMDKCWKTTRGGLDRLSFANRVGVVGNTLAYVRYIDDFGVRPMKAIWTDTGTGGIGDEKFYVVQTTAKVIQRCMLMTTDAGDLVLDPTCGSGSTAFVAEKWGRRWITCDTSRVAVTLAKQRLMTASFDYYELKHPHEGLRGGFKYATVAHITLGAIANNPEIDQIHDMMQPAVDKALSALNAALADTTPPVFVVEEGGRKGQKLDFGKGDTLSDWEVPFDLPAVWPAAARPPFEAFHVARLAKQRQMDASITANADQETLYDKPAVSKDKLRITGPFTVEAVPHPTVLSLDQDQPLREADVAIARSGESSRQHQWRDELFKTGIRGKGGQRLRFAELETLPGTRYLHAIGALADTGERVVVSFGPEHSALEQRQVELAMVEAGELFPRPKMIVFCAFTFDPEAAKDIDMTRGITALKAQMNTDLLTEDLKKNRSSNQSFWLMGQPDVDVRRRKDGLYEVEVNGFDYFDTVKGELVSGGRRNIALWLLDPDYDERSLFPRQIFFPMAGPKDGWHRLKKDIRAELDEDRLSHFHGTTSLPFEAGPNRRVAVKIVDDRGIESVKVIRLD